MLNLLFNLFVAQQLLDCVSFSFTRKSVKCICTVERTKQFLIRSCVPFSGGILHVVNGPMSYYSRAQGFTFNLQSNTVVQDWKPALVRKKFCVGFQTIQNLNNVVRIIILRSFWRFEKNNKVLVITELALLTNHRRILKRFLDSSNSSPGFFPTS